MNATLNQEIERAFTTAKYIVIESLCNYGGTYDNALVEKAVESLEDDGIKPTETRLLSYLDNLQDAMSPDVETTLVETYDPNGAIPF